MVYLGYSEYGSLGGLDFILFTLVFLFYKFSSCGCLVLDMSNSSNFAKNYFQHFCLSFCLSYPTAVLMYYHSTILDALSPFLCSDISFSPRKSVSQSNALE